MGSYQNFHPIMDDASAGICLVTCQLLTDFTSSGRTQSWLSTSFKKRKKTLELQAVVSPLAPRNYCSSDEMSKSMKPSWNCTLSFGVRIIFQSLIWVFS